MAINYELLNKGGISLGTNFELLSEKPLDSRLVVPSLEGLQNYIDNAAAYEGLIAYVSSEKKHYEVKVIDGVLSYRPFGLTEAELNEIITNATTAAMEFKGATATLPENPAKGDMWKVTASFEVAGETAKVGDSIVYNGEEWFLIPSGDDIEDTWRPVTGVDNDASLTFAAGDILDVAVAANGTVTYSHEEIEAPKCLDNKVQTRTYITEIVTDDHGHITGYKTGTENVDDTNTEYTFESQVESSDVSFNVTPNTEGAIKQTIFVDAYSKKQVDDNFKAKRAEKLDAVATDANVFVDTVAQDVDGNITITTKAVDFSAVNGRIDAQQTVINGMLNETIGILAKAKGYTDEEIDKLEEYVGEIPAGATATDIVGYVQEKTSGIASEGQMTELGNRVTKNEGDIKNLHNSVMVLNSPDTMTGSVANSIKNAINDLDLANTYAAKADGITSDERTKLAGIAAGATKVENVGNGKIKINDTEVTVYSHPASHTVSEISDFSDTVKDFETKENVKKVADDLAAYIESNDKALADETKARDDADKAFETRIAALEGNFGDGEGTVEAQIAAAVKAEEDARKEAVQGVAKDLSDYESANDARVKAVEDEVDAQQVVINGMINEGTGILAKAKKYTDDEVKELSDGQVTTNKNDIAAIKEDIGTDKLETTKQDITGAINELKAAIGTGGTAAVVTLTEVAPRPGYAKTYSLKQGDTAVGTIDIPKDMVVQSGTVETKTEAGDWGEAGTYIHLVLANATNDDIYVNVGTLVDIYKAQANAAQVQIAINSATREISATIVAGSVDTTALATDAVTTVKIADKNVTLGKLSTDVAGVIRAVVEKGPKWDNEVGAKALVEAHAGISGDATIHHTHTNKAELDLVKAGDVAKWDEAAQKASTALQEQDITGKADKVEGAVAGNFAGLDANGNLTDSGKKAADFATAAQGAKADTAVQTFSTAMVADYINITGSPIAMVSVTDKLKNGIAAAETALQSIGHGPNGYDKDELVISEKTSNIQTIELSAKTRASLAAADSAVQGAADGLKVNENKQVVFDDSVTFIFDCGGAEG